MQFDTGDWRTDAPLPPSPSTPPSTRTAGWQMPPKERLVVQSDRCLHTPLSEVGLVEGRAASILAPRMGTDEMTLEPRMTYAPLPTPPDYLVESASSAVSWSGVGMTTATNPWMLPASVSQNHTQNTATLLQHHVGCVAPQATVSDSQQQQSSLDAYQQWYASNALQGRHNIQLRLPPVRQRSRSIRGVDTAQPTPATLDPRSLTTPRRIAPAPYAPQSVTLPRPSRKSIDIHLTPMPRPPNAFILYRRDMYPKVASEHPNMLTQELSKKLGVMWRGESESVKEEYRRQSRKVSDSLRRLYHHPGK